MGTSRLTSRWKGRNGAYLRGFLDFLEAELAAWVHTWASRSISTDSFSAFPDSPGVGEDGWGGGRGGAGTVEGARLNGDVLEAGAEGGDEGLQVVVGPVRHLLQPLEVLRRPLQRLQREERVRWGGGRRR